MSLNDVQKNFAHYQSLFADTWHESCELMCHDLPATLWVHPNRSTSQMIEDRLIQDQYHVKPIEWLPNSLEVDQGVKLGRRLEFRSGLFHLQEAASMLPPKILDPQPGERVLDLCAAPGGKSAQIALMMKNQGTLIVNDLSYARLRALRGIQERLGIYNIVLCAEQGQNFLKEYSACFDKVLVDAPCSCEGTIRKHGLGVFKSNIKEYQNQLVYLQRKLLERALILCKPGGRVVYSTCTFNPAENEGVVSEMLRRYPHSIELEKIQWPHLQTAPSASEWQDEIYHPDVSSCARIHPYPHNTGGFFIASFKVCSSLTKENPGEWKKPEGLDQAQNQYYRQWLEQYYGIDESQVEGDFTVGTKRLISIVNSQLRLPPTECQVAGLPMFHRKGSVPHLTQAAALQWGHLAQKHIIELQTRDEVNHYYRRESHINHQADQLATYTQGDYMIRYQNINLGTAFLRTKHQEKVLESHYPKAWRLSPNASAI